jgi:hypothetical protein
MPMRAISPAKAPDLYEAAGPKSTKRCRAAPPAGTEPRPRPSVIMRRLAPPVLLALALAGCGQRTEEPDPPRPTPHAAPVAPAAPAPAAGEIASSSDTLSFRYTWPAAVAGVPGLADRLRGDAEVLRRDAARLGTDDAAERRASGTPLLRHSLEKRWRVANQGLSLLSLAAEIESYGGGAHGMTSFDALLIDRRTNRPIGFDALWADAPRARMLLRSAFCPALDRERARRRGDGATPGDPFNGCPDLSEQVLVPAGSGATVDRIDVLIEPYAAGPFAEGSYTVPLPLTPQLRALAAPAYRAALGG